ncbi:NADH-cytochrome b5 reductase [Didymosphaeria variabile]|uniref:cytochrome-b5 reductase n=1 Tax=Didymosphaeria variabile TaxID=1932322 RepID=A0A9W8XS73_9PLEO|nr:NADH-cytochrome b5 reductase [Didymosphaeria variabile]KAJ4358135.1 NADH-cytochrome b5 reductase [Didymosphaeria variabile]
MFAQRVFRPANTLSQQVRRYASADAPKSGGNGLLYTGVALAAVSGGYFYMRRNTPTGQAGDAPPSAEAEKIPASSGQPAKAAFTGGEQGFLSLKLDKSEIINHNTKKLTFLLPEEDMESGLHVASAVITKYKGPEMQKPVIRPYTPTSDVDQKGTVDFIIKKYPNGPMSEHLHNLEPGQRLDIKGPIPKYQWTANKQSGRPFLLIKHLRNAP